MKRRRDRRRPFLSLAAGYREEDRLPPNAWGLLIKPRRTTVHAGRGIERGEDFIAEGAWAGPFSAKGALSSPFRCGSGAVIDGKRIVVFGPSHSLDPVYCFVGRGYLAVSNSIHLAIALSKDAMPRDLGAARKCAETSMAGFHHYDRILYRTPTGMMLRLAFGMWTIDPGRLRIAESGPAIGATEDFADFAGYRRLLLKTLRRIIDNARAPERRTPYGDLVATCSSGYDSPACAALARELGCREALTLRTARGGGVDSGKPVAESLGLACHEYERFGAGLEERNEERRDSFLDARHLLPVHDEFIGSVNTAEDLWLAAFAPHLPGRILFTGFQGGQVWKKGCPSGPTMKRSDTSGSGVEQFRKRLGFVHVPVPFIGSTNHVRLAALYSAAEMAPYHVPGAYDHPVPRRIAEDAGVPRDLFGQRKSAGSVMVVESGARRQAAFEALVESYRAAIPPRGRKDDAGARQG